MKEEIKKYTDDFFDKLISKFGFSVRKNIISDKTYLREYVTENYVIEIEKYHQEFYSSVFCLFNQDKKINLFNLLSFLKQNDSNIPESKFFRKEKNIEECYKMQLSHISNTIYDNLNLLDIFFSKNDYENNIHDLEIYWKSKYPELYRSR